MKKQVAVPFVPGEWFEQMKQVGLKLAKEAGLNPIQVDCVESGYCLFTIPKPLWISQQMLQKIKDGLIKAGLAFNFSDFDLDPDSEYIVDQPDFEKVYTLVMLPA